MTNILITGASGFLGGHLLRRFPQAKYLTRTNLTKIRDTDFDVVFHAAAEIYDKMTMFISNVQLTQDLLTQLHYKKFIYIGSSSEYGRKKYPTNEQDFLAPETIYEGTKAAASMLCLSHAHQYKQDICVVRPYSLYGPNDNPAKFIPTLFREQKITVATGMHDWIYVDDFVNVLCTIAQTPKEQTLGDVVNVGTGIMTSNIGVVNLFKALTHKDIEVTLVDRLRTYDSDVWCCDNARVVQKYAGKFITLREGLLRML